MVLDYHLAKEGVHEGYTMIIDMEGSTFAHMAKVNFITMRKFLYYVQVRVFVRQRDERTFCIWFNLLYRKPVRFVYENFTSLIFHRSWTKF